MTIENRINAIKSIIADLTETIAADFIQDDIMTLTALRTSRREWENQTQRA